MPFGLFSKKGNQGIDYKARLEHKLYLARENPEPVFDLADCALKAVPQGIYSLCKVFRKDVLYLQENQLTSLSGGGTLMDLSLLQVLDLHSNNFVTLPDDIKYLKNLKVLNVSKNHLKYLPETIGQLDKLNLLNVSSNNLKSVPEFLGKLKRLQQLDLRDNKSLRTLPPKLALAVSLKELRVTATNFTHPPAHILQQGTEATMRFLAQELGVEYVSPADSLDDSSETSGNSSYCGMEWEEKDRLFQAKILQLERLKEQRQHELLTLEKEMEEHQKRELQLQNMMKSNKGRLLEDLVEQQSKLESEILRIQQDREVERLRLVRHLQKVEQKADSVLSQMLALGAARDSKQLQHLLEQERQEDERLLNLVHEEYKSLHRKEVLNAMETLLEEECKREKKLREYEDGRAEVTRTLLSREVEADRQLQEMLSTQEQLQSQLVGRLQKDEELQRAAVAALLERSDARSWGLVHQVALVQAQLAALTAVEMERKKLEMTEQVKEISEKRLALSCLLMDLLDQQAKRRQQLLNTLNEMEKRRWVDEEDNSKDGDFWLRQYQRLLDSRPVNLIDMEKSLDPMLAQHLVLSGAIHCLPFLAQWIHSKEALKGLTDADLKKAHVSLPEDREAILQAVRLYLEECELAKRKLDNVPHSNPSPTAPPIEEAEQPPAAHISAAECVICMDAQCEVIFVPCGHMCTCIKCAEVMAEADCPMCRNPINKKIRVILP